MRKSFQGEVGLYFEHGFTLAPLRLLSTQQPGWSSYNFSQILSLPSGSVFIADDKALSSLVLHSFRPQFLLLSPCSHSPATRTSSLHPGHLDTLLQSLCTYYFSYLECTSQLSIWLIPHFLQASAQMWPFQGGLLKTTLFNKATFPIPSWGVLTTPFSCFIFSLADNARETFLLSLFHSLLSPHTRR